MNLFRTMQLQEEQIRWFYSDGRYEDAKYYLLLHQTASGLDKEKKGKTEAPEQPANHEREC